MRDGADMTDLLQLLQVHRFTLSAWLDDVSNILGVLLDGNTSLHLSAIQLLMNCISLNLFTIYNIYFFFSFANRRKGGEIARAINL